MIVLEMSRNPHDESLCTGLEHSFVFTGPVDTGV